MPRACPARAKRNIIPTSPVPETPDPGAREASSAGGAAGGRSGGGRGARGQGPGGLQRRGHRRRHGRSGGRRRNGRSRRPRRPDRETQDGRRLPELRMRAEQGAHPIVARRRPDAPRRSLRPRSRPAVDRLRPRGPEGQSAAREDRAARLAGAFRGPGVDVFLGHATLESAHTVRVGDTLLRTRNIVLATGGRAAVPDVPGLAEAGYFTNETIFEREEAPGRLLVIGGDRKSVV